MAYGITRGSGKPSGQMAAFGKQEKKPNPYGKVKDEHLLKLKMQRKKLSKVDKGYDIWKSLARNERKFGKKGSLEPQVSQRKKEQMNVKTKGMSEETR